MNEEFWRQIFGSGIRHFITLLGAFLVTKGWLTEEQAGSIFNESLVAPIIGAVMVLGGLTWSWLKVKYNINLTKAAIKAPAGTPIAEVKQDALSKEATQSSI